jgi:hypothetical protein
MLATELEHPLLVPYVSHSRPRGLTPDESMLLAAALAFLEGLWRATRSAHPMQVWRVERWLRDHRLTIAQFREFLAREKAVPHSIEDSLDGRVIIPGRPFFFGVCDGDRAMELAAASPLAIPGRYARAWRPRLVNSMTRRRGRRLSSPGNSSAPRSFPRNVWGHNRQNHQNRLCRFCRLVPRAFFEHFPRCAG